MLLAAVASSGAIVNTDWRVLLTVGDVLPLPVSLRFGGRPPATSQVDAVMDRKLEALSDAAPLARAGSARCAAPRMGLFDALPGFWKQPVPDGYVRARHCLFLGTDEATKEAATAVFERVRQGSLSLDEATRQYSYCPTRDQLPAGDLGTFASLSCMRDVDELRSFDGRLALPYEGRNTRAFDDAVFAAPLGEPQLVESAFGFHIVLVTERGAGSRVIIAPEDAVSVADEKQQLSRKPNSDAGRSL